MNDKTPTLEFAFKLDGAAQEIAIAVDLRGVGHAPFSKPFLILLDLNMPGMNGFEFLDELRDDPMLRDSIVFVLTTSNSETDRPRIYRKNVAGYIVKSDVGPSFKKAVDLLDCYWTTVTLPA